MSDKTEDQIREGLKLLAEDVQAPEGEVGRRALTRRLPRISPRLGVAFAGVAICAALAGLAAAGTFDGAGPGRANYGDDVMCCNTVGGSVTANRGSDGTLISVHVGIRSLTSKFPFKLDVVHSTPGGGKDVVYATQISGNPVTWLCATDSTGHIGPTGADGPIGWKGPHGTIHECTDGTSRWSGTLVPSDWRGGCQSSGEYSVVVGDNLMYTSFTCDATTGRVGPSGQEGPTG
jgi:hypothetical protein